MPRSLSATLAFALLASFSLGCEPPPLPSFQVKGTAKHVVQFHPWEPLLIGGKVVKWKSKMTRVHEDPIGMISYELFDPEGKTLASNSFDYRSSFKFRPPFEKGDTIPISIPAYRGDVYGNTVALVRITIHAPFGNAKPKS